LAVAGTFAAAYAANRRAAVESILGRTLRCLRNGHDQPSPGVDNERNSFVKECSRGP
jgi:hypothetical protein